MSSSYTYCKRKHLFLLSFLIIAVLTGVRQHLSETCICIFFNAGYLLIHLMTYLHFLWKNIYSGSLTILIVFSAYFCKKKKWSACSISLWCFYVHSILFKSYILLIWLHNRKCDTTTFFYIWISFTVLCLMWFSKNLFFWYVTLQ